jgi:hypothetical protein
MVTTTKKGRTRLTPEQQAAHDDKILADFNARYPVDTVVWYWTTLPFGPVKETKIRCGAWFIPSGQFVCKVDGVAGGVSIWHIREVDESRRDEVKPTIVAGRDPE